MFDVFVALDSAFLPNKCPENEIFSNNDTSHNIFHASQFNKRQLKRAIQLLKLNEYGLYTCTIAHRRVKISLLEKGSKKFGTDKPILVFTKTS